MAFFLDVAQSILSTVGLVEPISEAKAIGSCIEQNARHRKTQEDFLTVHATFPATATSSSSSSSSSSTQQEPFTLLSIYDGHGGADAALFASKNLPTYLADTLSFSGGGAEGDEEGDSVLLALSAAYDKTDMELSKIDKSHLDISLQQGTCATNVLVRGGLIYTANVGDSDCCYYEVKDGKVDSKTLTIPHRCSNEAEAKRIKDAGGFIFRNRVSGTLAVTRALGHRDEKEFISGTPHLSKTEAKEGGWIVIASDGIWDYLGKDEVGEIVKSGKEEGASADAICERIKDKVMSKYSRDNIAIILMFL